MRTGSDTKIALVAAPAECWERRGDAIVDAGNNCTALDFVVALKNQNAAAWVALKTIIFNPVLNEEKISVLVREKKFEADEIFGIFVERMIFKGKINRLKEPDKIISFMQQCIRNQITRCTTKKEKARATREVLIDDYFQNQPDIDTKGETNPIDSIPEDETSVAARASCLMEDEKAIVRRCFVEFWRKHPRHAYVLNLRDMGLSDREIKEFIGARTDNNVTQLARRGGKILADQITAKKIPLLGMRLAAPARKGGCKHA